MKRLYQPDFDAESVPQPDSDELPLFVLPVVEPVELPGVETAGLLAAGELGCAEADVLDVLLDAGDVDEDDVVDGSPDFEGEAAGEVAAAGC